MEKENKKSSQKGLVALLVLLLVITIVAVIIATWAWAKYTTSTSGTATGNVAKWNVTVSSNATDFTKSYTQVLSEQMAPGTSGKLDTTLNIGADTEVGVDYTIVIDKVTVEYVNSTTSTSGTATIPANMIFKDADGNTIEHSALTAASTTNVKIASGHVDAGDGLNNTITPLTWEWPYETTNGDEQDTTDGKTPVKITVSYKITATQSKPTAN